jgi:hypothetical protein
MIYAQVSDTTSMGDSDPPIPPALATDAARERYERCAGFGFA